jgi:sensor histidine kinase YesM
MKQTNKALSTIGIHAALWMFLLVMPVLTIAPFIVAEQGVPSQKFYMMFTYSSVVLMLIFYVNYLFLFPKFYINRRRIIYFLLVVVTILSIVIITRATMVRYFSFQQEYSKPKSIFIAFAIFRMLLAFFLSGALVVYERWQKSEQQRLLAEVSFLKAQINPHFLFNTLNGIYTLVLKKADNAADSVSKLSAIMRYVATEATNEKVALEDEINYITNYIDLQKLRLTNSTQVKFSVTGSPSALQVEPLLLITFIENAFKFGVSTEKESVIQIDLIITESELRLFVQNQKVRNKIQPQQDSGIGLENTINRLKRNYHNHYTLNITEVESSYAINLTLRLK